MSTRTNQKARTRQALLDAASGLLAAGVVDPSMEKLAETAKVSRATAYRYFDSVSDVVWQVASDELVADVDEVMSAAGSDLVTRVLAAEETINGYLFGDADGARAFERAALDRRLRGVAVEVDRAARRLQCIDAALEPVAGHLTTADLRRVRHGLALAMGTQAVVALLDTCRLDLEEARAATRFTCETIAAEAQRLAVEGPRT